MAGGRERGTNRGGLGGDGAVVLGSQGSGSRNLWLLYLNLNLIEFHMS